MGEKKWVFDQMMFTQWKETNYEYKTVETYFCKKLYLQHSKIDILPYNLSILTIVTPENKQHIFNRSLTKQHFVEILMYLSAHK